MVDIHHHHAQRPVVDQHATPAVDQLGATQGAGQRIEAPSRLETLLQALHRPAHLHQHQREEDGQDAQIDDAKCQHPAGGQRIGRPFQHQDDVGQQRHAQAGGAQKNAPHERHADRVDAQQGAEVEVVEPGLRAEIAQRETDLRAGAQRHQRGRQGFTASTVQLQTDQIDDQHRQIQRQNAHLAQPQQQDGVEQMAADRQHVDHVEGGMKGLLIRRESERELLESSQKAREMRVWAGHVVTSLSLATIGGQALSRTNWPDINRIRY